MLLPENLTVSEYIDKKITELENTAEASSILHDKLEDGIAEYDKSLSDKLKDRMSKVLFKSRQVLKPKKNILLVEDDDDDYVLISEALEQSSMHYNLDRAKDGIEALEFLSTQLEKSNSNMPDLIFMDLNMPRKNGLETLKEIKNDPVLKNIIVIIMTSSSSPLDVEIAYENGANSFVTKSSKFNDLVQDINAVDRFWFETALRPDNQI